MAKKRKSTITPPLVQPVEEVTQSEISVFDEVSAELQVKRHNTIGSLFDKAADIVGGYLDDPSVDLIAKMLPAKLAIDLYTTQEKFKREDERIDIEKRKLAIEEKKANIPGIGTFNQQNNYISATPENLAELKKKQEEILASFRNNKNPID